jgi:hypothetical protein
MGKDNIEVQENMRREYDLNALLTLFALTRAVTWLSNTTWR